MDYNAAGAPKMNKKAPKHQEHNQYGSDNKPFGGPATKEELLARMKAAQAAKLDKPADPAERTATDEAGGKPMRGEEDLG